MSEKGKVQDLVRYWTVNSGVASVIYSFVCQDLAGVFTRCCTGYKSSEQVNCIAKEMVDKFFENFHKGRMVRHLLILKVYDRLRLDKKSYGIELPEISQKIIDLKGDWLYHEDTWEKQFYDIVKCLESINHDYLQELFSRATNDLYWDQNFIKKVLGRYVWNYFYQMCKPLIPLKVIYA
jgi:hypothetical protein